MRAEGCSRPEIVGPTYVGCAVVRLLQGRTLHQRIEGVWQGIMGRAA